MKPSVTHLVLAFGTTSPRLPCLQSSQKIIFALLPTSLQKLNNYLEN